MTRDEAIRRDPGDVRMVDCVCGRGLLAASEAEWRALLPPNLQKGKPQVMAGRRAGRPRCGDCLADYDAVYGPPEGA